MIAEPQLAVDEIQGNILPGFGTRCLLLLGLKIEKSVEAAATLSRLAPRITTLRQMNGLREFRRNRLRAGDRGAGIDCLLLNVALAPAALKAFGLRFESIPETPFLAGMAKADLQDPQVAGQPTGWVVGDPEERSPDVFLILASDSVAIVESGAEALVHLLNAGGYRCIYRERGDRLPNNIEHFGFRDDISQPGVRGLLSARPDDYLTRRLFDAADPRAEEFARPGQPLIWPGQFLYGYPTLLDDPLVPGPIAEPPHAWMANGSYLVFRRLKQDVSEFQTFLANGAAQASTGLNRTVSPEEFAAWVVGRWPDGTPVDRSPHAPDPAVAADDERVNFFAFGTDEPDAALRIDGVPRTVPGCPADLFALRCPHFAHIRKVNPRGPTDQGPAAAFRMLRRGIPYGPLWQPGEAPGADRGLLFLAYMRSPSRQFLTVNATWANTANAPEGHGHDLLIGQVRVGSRTAERLESVAVTVTVPGPNSWVIPTGGGFYFAPARSEIAKLGSDPT